MRLVCLCVSAWDSKCYYRGAAMWNSPFPILDPFPFPLLSSMTPLPLPLPPTPSRQSHQAFFLCREQSRSGIPEYCSSPLCLVGSFANRARNGSASPRGDQSRPIREAETSQVGPIAERLFPSDGSLSRESTWGSRRGGGERLGDY